MIGEYLEGDSVGMNINKSAFKNTDYPQTFWYRLILLLFSIRTYGRSALKHFFIYIWQCDAYSE